jgi:2-polyprenyl-3-methyl-5-hydroxy-6-metoxy-1,4-benzoquinol methylase
VNIEFREFKDREDFTHYVRSSREVIPKNEYIQFLCKEKDILDVGCINHGWERALALGENWPFAQIKRVAKSVLGIDLLSEDAQRLSSLGYNIVEGDAENFNLSRTFDVIVCGDIIEHLNNIGVFLETISRHMDTDSLCVITTPNPFNIEQIMSAIFHNRIYVNLEHTLWLDPQVMFELVSRTSLQIVGFHWIRTRFTFPVRKRFYGGVINAFSRYVMKKRPICGRDFAVILKRK